MIVFGVEGSRLMKLSKEIEEGAAQCQNNTLKWFFWVCVICQLSLLIMTCFGSKDWSWIIALELSYIYVFVVSFKKRKELWPDLFKK